MGTAWRELEERISAAVTLRRRAVAVGFLDAAPARLEKFKGSEPSGCSFWRLAAGGNRSTRCRRIILTVRWERIRTIFRCRPAREKETEHMLKMMSDLGYVKPEEVAQIPRLAKTPLAIAYAPLGDATFEPDAVLLACKPAGAMLLQEAATRAGIGSGAPALGRPTYMALPATLQAGSILSLGCMGNRVYTRLGDDEVYFVVRGTDLAALADALQVISLAGRIGLCGIMRRGGGRSWPAREGCGKG